MKENQNRVGFVRLGKVVITARQESQLREACLDRGKAVTVSLSKIKHGSKKKVPEPRGERENISV